MNNKLQPKPYVTTPRFIADDLKDGKLTRNELLVYCWLRINTDPYGNVATHLSAIKDDILPDISENYINKILLSLLKKKYLYFEKRQGHRGSFRISFGDWLLPGGGIRNIDELFLDKVGNKEVKSKDESEVNKSSDTNSQMLEEQKRVLAEGFSVHTQPSGVRGYHNHTDNDNNKRSILYKKEERQMPVSGYTPRTYEETECYNIATKLGETHMDFLLGTLRKQGILTIQRAWGIYREVDRSKIKNPPAYFNKILQELINGKRG